MSIGGNVVPVQQNVPFQVCGFDKEDAKRFFVVALVVAALVTAAYFAGDAATSMCKAADLTTPGLIMGAGALWGVTTGLGIGTIMALKKGWKYIDSAGSTEKYLKEVFINTVAATLITTSVGSIAALCTAFPEVPLTICWILH